MKTTDVFFFLFILSLFAFKIVAIVMSRFLFHPTNFIFSIVRTVSSYLV